MILFLLEENIERGQRAIATRDVLLQLELICVSEFIARVHLLLEHAQIVADHHDLVKERLQRHFLRLHRRISRAQDEGAPLPPVRDALHNRLIFLQAERLHHRVRSFADEIAQRHLQLGHRCSRLGRGELARSGNDRSPRIIEGDISSKIGEGFHDTDAVLRVSDLHPNVKALNWHRHGSICTSPANSAMLPLKDRRDREDCRCLRSVRV